MNTTTKTGTKIGAALGIISFLIVGLLPGIYFGSYGTLMIISRLQGGTSVDPTTLVRMFVVLGVMLGISCMGFLFTVAGSVFGTVVGALVSMVQTSVTVEKEAEAKI